MDAILILALVIIGFSAGLRTFSAPAVVAWAAHLGCLMLNNTQLAFMASPITAVILSLLAFGEYIADLMPGTPARTAWLGLTGRIITGSFSAASLLVVSEQNILWCVIGGAVAIAAAFVGYQARTRLVRALDVKDAFIAIPEDLIAVGIAVVAVCLSR